MSTATLVLGESGSGKSTALRNMDPAKTLLIQALRKPLPFPNAAHWTVFSEANKAGNIFVTDKTPEIMTLMQRTQRKVIVLDDAQYVMTNEFMRRSDERGYDKFTEIGRHFWDVLMLANALPSDVRVYILSHSDQSDTGLTRIKTIGKMLNEKITPEGMFTIVLRCLVVAGIEDVSARYVLATHNSGSDTVKSPMGMWEADHIPNDLAAVDKRICEYYKIKEG